MKPQILKIRHNGIGFTSNENAILLITTASHHYVLFTPAS